MQTLRSLQQHSTFKPPTLTAEEWEQRNSEVAAWERKQLEAACKERLSRSGVPTGYIGAKCSDSVLMWAEKPSKGLLLQGGVGVGKTYQACAALQKHMERGTARFATFDDLLRECKATYQNWDTEEAVIGRYANTGMLCIDDMGKERVTEWSLPIIFAIINKRSMSGKPTIVTTQYTGKQLVERMTVNGDSETARAIISRMMEYDRIALEGEDRRRNGQKSQHRD